MQIYGQNHFNFISVWYEIMSLKSDKLELGFSIFDIGTGNLLSVFILIDLLSKYVS